MAGYIYVLRSNLTIGGESIVKIGMTTRSVAQRVRELSTGSPVALELVYSLSVENPKALEKSLHRRFGTRRIQAGGGTEYFSVEASEVVAEIERIAVNISKQRARAARDMELRKYKEAIGAGQLERGIEDKHADCVRRLGPLSFPLRAKMGMDRPFHGLLSRADHLRHC